MHLELVSGAVEEGDRDALAVADPGLVHLWALRLGLLEEALEVQQVGLVL